jgi:UDP-GlcNAc:undecaprenyl-phosphate/decaprenyl-phosphate GlcNAc-1-phosphate transferase
MLNPKINYFLIFIASGILSFFSTFFLNKASLKYRFLINRGISLSAGISAAVSFFTVACVFLYLTRSFSKASLAILSSSAIMLGFGILDDIFELSVRAKFSVEIIAATLLIYFGVSTKIIYFGLVPNIIITIFWVLLITNAANHLDIVDGLAGCAGLIAGAGFLAVSLFHGDLQMVIMTLSFLGAISGFLLLNLPPAKVYMGNSGSHFIGFTLAALSIAVSYASNENKIALLSPFFILGLLIFDTTFLILMRLLKSRSIFKKSNDHFALKLLKKGFSKRAVLCLIVFLALLYSATGVSLIFAGNQFSIIAIVCVFLISLALIFKIGKVEIDQ